MDGVCYFLILLCVLNVCEGKQCINHRINCICRNLAISRMEVQIGLQHLLESECKDIKPLDCEELYSLGYKQNGVYKIYPDGNSGFDVYCDMTTDGGGWTVFQRRFNGKVDFYKTWMEYKHGFGNRSEEYWLGNDRIHLLTSLNSYRLRVDMEDFKRVHKFAAYSNFAVGDESTGYVLTAYGYSGTAGDALKPHSGYKFTTKDKDQDTYKDNCAVIYKGAWWYNNCYSSSLNGLYVKTTKENSSSCNWYYFSKPPYHIPLKTSEMKIKRKH